MNLCSTITFQLLKKTIKIIILTVKQLLKQFQTTMSKDGIPPSGWPGGGGYEKRQRPTPIFFDASFICYTCDHVHYNERFKIGSRDQIACIANENLDSIISWHKMLNEEKDELLKNKQFNDYILYNRMENIKRVLDCFRRNGELDETLATHYAVAHMVIEHDLTSENECIYPNIFVLFIEYIKITYDCLNFINGNHHPSSQELTGFPKLTKKDDDQNDNNHEDIKNNLIR